ncbi:MAG TPA: hypothetical protein VEI52_00830 [Terriglobales bacterium]|nr:hypothetical protein [Terriglobales bacterium]
MGVSKVSLGIALLLIFLLFLIDKHHLWREIATNALLPLAIVILVTVCWLSWTKYRDQKEQRRMAANNKKAVQACIARFPGQDVAQACEADPELTSCSRLTVPWKDLRAAYNAADQSASDSNQPSLVDIDLSTNCFYPPTLPVRMPDGTVTEFPETMPASQIQKEIAQKFPSLYAKPAKPHPVKHNFPQVRSDVSWDLTLTSEQSGGVHVGVVHPGEKVTLLYSDSYSAKVKTKKGMVGWADAGNFEVVDPERFATSDAEGSK